jgi:hypothetical protein
MGSSSHSVCNIPESGSTAWQQIIEIWVVKEVKISCIMTPCSYLGSYRYFGGSCCFLLQDRRPLSHKITCVIPQETTFSIQAQWLKFCYKCSLKRSPIILNILLTENKMENLKPCFIKCDISRYPKEEGGWVHIATRYACQRVIDGPSGLHIRRSVFRIHIKYKIANSCCCQTAVQECLADVDKEGLFYKF